MVSQAWGRYTDPALRGKTYYGANVLGTPVTTQAGLSATTPALTLYNPVGSGVILSLLGVRVCITASPAAAVAFCLAANAQNATPPATTTDATLYNGLLTGIQDTPKGRCYRIATLAAAPVAFRLLGGTTGASAIGGYDIDKDIGGAVEIDEGVAVSIQSSAAAVVVCEFNWEEILKRVV